MKATGMERPLLGLFIFPALTAAFSRHTTCNQYLYRHLLLADTISCENSMKLGRIKSISSLQTKKSAYDDSAYGSFEEGSIGISRDDNLAPFSLYYRLYNQQSKKTPLVVLHGGPSLPSQYQYPMVPNLSKERPIIFYDQLGCGKSDEPKNKKLYSIAQAVDDLNTVITTLISDKDTATVHIFGHSYGGCLAYEYAKLHPRRIQSLILSNAPSNMKSAGDAYDQLALRNPLGFWKQRVCSVDSPALDDALSHVGHVWAGIDAVLDYVAAAPIQDAAFPNTLVISCVNDFCIESSRGWRQLLTDGACDVEEVCLEDSAHYPHLEVGETFGRGLDKFLSKNDNTEQHQ